MTKKLGELMETQIVRITWKDAMGSTVADSTTLARLGDTIRAIQNEHGKVVGVRHLEDIKP